MKENQRSRIIYEPLLPRLHMLAMPVPPVLMAPLSQKTDGASPRFREDCGSALGRPE